MAKSTMKLKYKSPKRERNKKKEEVSDLKLKSVITTIVSVLIFIGAFYLCILGMDWLGTFDKGYTKPSKEETTISYENILIGTSFNRKESEYFVIYDDYTKNKYPYTNNIVSEKAKLPVYKVDMSKGENATYVSDTSNSNAKNASELKINDITLIRFKNGSIVKYITGSDKIEEYFN